MHPKQRDDPKLFRSAAGNLKSHPSPAAGEAGFPLWMSDSAVSFIKSALAKVIRLQT